jgi:hypothetical protein
MLVFKQLFTSFKVRCSIVNNQRNSVIIFHQDFVASTLSDFFQGHMDRGLVYMPNRSGENPKEEEEVEYEHF